MMVPPLVYVIGPSGVGKDSIMTLARAACDPQAIVFAHRYITRPPRSGDENHVALSEAEFAARVRAGWFALAWRSHGLGYGIGREIDLWRANGAMVVVNGSRAYLDEAAARYADLVPVLITADPAVLRARLQARQRESAADIDARLRAAAARPAGHPRLKTIDNSGTLAASGGAFMRLLADLQHEADRAPGPNGDGASQVGRARVTA
jgi:ribose 1,5-bisphosphokinase